MKTDKIDKDSKNMVALSTYGRDENYIRNKLWLNGVSSLLLHGVGDGMVPWVCAQLRIPCLMIFDPAPSGEAHKSCIEKHLKDKVKKAMLEATPGHSRWYRSNEQLQCMPDVTEEKKTKKRTAAPAPKTMEEKVPNRMMKHQLMKQNRKKPNWRVRRRNDPEAIGMMKTQGRRRRRS